MSGATVLDVFAEALDGQPCTVSAFWSGVRAVPVERWCGAADHGDRAVLAHCRSATIDLGCGPGRMAEQLSLDGISVLGVDVAPGAVRRARARGVEALRCDLFAPLPDEGKWASALLADGNIGIGGDPVRLLCRVRRLLAPEGTVVLDLAPPGTGLRVGALRLRLAGRTSPPFPWALLGVDAVADVTAMAGLTVAEVHEHEGRWYAVLAREEVPPRCLS